MPVRRLLLASFVLLGCGTEAPVPDKPTWAEDVLPIVRANCFHCHGPQANYKMFGNKRWDVYDMNAEPLMRLGLGPVMEEIEVGKPPATTFLGLKDNTAFYAYTKSEVESARMPPPPATRLSARDIEVLEKWSDTGFTQGSHKPNYKAAVRWLDKGAKLLAITDDNGDQVLGKLDCGGTEVVILRSGSHKLPAEATAACTGTLFDGFEETTVNLR